ncbi:hypothetical protein LX36DRAFT_417463 [Colletotrichum falcatum]|nr:hypothetical protein LX36DRAFT_417463 [Colletotrichum falcatum]
MTKSGSFICPFRFTGPDPQSRKIYLQCCISVSGLEDPGCLEKASAVKHFATGVGHNAMAHTLPIMFVVSLSPAKTGSNYEMAILSTWPTTPRCYSQTLTNSSGLSFELYGCVANLFLFLFLFSVSGTSRFN